MAKEKKVTPVQPSVESEPIVLQSADGTPLVTFAPAVVTNLRHMVTRLANEKQLTQRIALIATLPEEGVTYVSLALGATLAHDWRARVCVVELNWHRPGLLKLAPGLASPGCAAVLDQVAPLDDALVKTSLDGLTLLPAGEMPFGKRTMVARGAELKTLVEQLAAQFDYLVLDIPAINLTSDAIPLAALGSAACLVVRQGITPIADAQRALDDVRQLNMLGVVMNRVRVHTPRLILGLIPQE